MYLQNALIREIQNESSRSEDEVELVSFSVPGSGFNSPSIERADPLGERSEINSKGSKKC